MSKPSFKPFLALLLLALLSACAGQSVSRGGGQSITEAQLEPFDGPKPRIAVGRILDKSGDGEHSLTHQLGLMLGDERKLEPGAVTGGIRDLLTTALFNSGQFIVLERELLDDILSEQSFSRSQQEGVDPVQLGQLEGVELLLVGALTSFDAGQSGGLAFPIPFPVGDNGDIGILDVEIRSSYVAMELRILDVRTGRVVSALGVEGKARKFGAGLAGIMGGRHGHVRLPVLLSVFKNTPMEEAIGKMVDSAVEALEKKIQSQSRP